LLLLDKWNYTDAPQLNAWKKENARLHGKSSMRKLNAKAKLLIKYEQCLAMTQESNQAC